MLRRLAAPCLCGWLQERVVTLTSFIFVLYYAGSSPFALKEGEKKNRQTCLRTANVQK